MITFSKIHSAGSEPPVHTFVCRGALQRRPERGPKRPSSGRWKYQDGSILARLESRCGAGGGN